VYTQFSPQDADRLDLESKKVFQALGFVKDVIQKDTLIMLSGSATILLETVMDFTNLLNNYVKGDDRYAPISCS
jgi:hypothetical protein